ncbi:uncharacterized protein MONOS_10962 [Monocercomonoides exilis]|uniref:uncharacterized protein n=1 Tax=Monocercomonoides exilis TaxID=2049356 RepID=UPI00355A2F5D|nr:hypothetical protein MONOS_10962 [Monocercomonoides exilis]|eukprot:MONOS_10962.1-p1 / transcript=MONOS_10962.1 / gene=MONOS_10962 / organism=Monocercomonoides_exilis_PA203 / gene_product=unspecified product / transcript_product=unspecified product / location=Mono_scaffold00522:25842-26678(+) / protein_length=262 / sequence_SO=supercontig / SO=protein_coding / is_pseudo=false
MIIEEEEKIEGKNEKLLVDLCECYLLLNRWASSKFLSICVHCLLKVSLKKEENEEARKEVEIALLALSNIAMWKFIEQNLYLKEIKEIIQCHQKHHNLTRLAYQSAWQFLINRLYEDYSLVEVVVNELHFGREAARELDELRGNVDWKRKEERGKEAKEVHILIRWLDVIGDFFFECRLSNEEYIGLISSMTRLFRASRDNYREINFFCICLIGTVADNRALEIEDLFKSEAIDAALEEIIRSNTKYSQIDFYLSFFRSTS